MNRFVTVASRFDVFVHKGCTKSPILSSLHSSLSTFTLSSSSSLSTPPPLNTQNLHFPLLPFSPPLLPTSITPPSPLIHVLSLLFSLSLSPLSFNRPSSPLSAVPFSLTPPLFFSFVFPHHCHSLSHFLSSAPMARTKQTGRRTAREIPPPLPCLSNYVEEDWFEEDSEKKAYSERLSRMHIIPPRYVGDGAITEDKYPEFWRLIDVQGLHQFLLQREG
ncbi:hypothetical protein PIB30_061308 [Stylosanthes scabra]|uniref:Uncharacterized protein n=1 Tax=Stylosanthes scabra TaxID=79078 RepID=A0ABU6QLG3_9FABA|nr:hypothetical protein [Stylosanthes scabra]